MTLKHCRSILWVGLSLVALGAPAMASVNNATRDQPNVVLIITDDIGYGDFGCYGAPDVRTPNIDRLAREGVKLTDFYASPQCTPTRASLITGRYQQRVRLERALGSVGAALEDGLPATGSTLPALLRNNGYATALIGKWHLGYKPQFGPNAHGFDYFFGFLSGYVDFYTHTRGGDGAAALYENRTPVEVAGYMTDLITERSVRFIEEIRARPFFLEVAYSAAHWPFQPPNRYSKAANNSSFQGPSDSKPATRRDYVAMVERADEGVGEILRTLDKHSLTRRTLIIFTNDNGGEWLSRNAPLFHRKDTLWEGGIRVPAIFRWPGRLPAGKTSRQLGIMMDITASILDASKTRVPDSTKLDGVSLLPMLTGRAQRIERALFWRINVPERKQKAVRRGDWKLLIDGDDLLLFNLRTDIGERHDLARARPDIVRALLPLINDWEEDVDREAAKAR